MSSNFSSIDDLIKNKKDSNLDKGFKVQRTLREVNRKFEEKQVAIKAQELGYEYINLHGFPLDIEALPLLSEEDAKRFQCVVFHHEGGELKVGAINPASDDFKKVRALLEAQKYKVKVYLISPDSFKDVLPNYERVVVEKATDFEHISLDEEKIKSNSEKFVRSATNPDEFFSRADTSDVMSQIFSRALDVDASDIHIESKPDSAKLRLRIDGVLQDVGELPEEAYKKVLSRIKVLARMKLNVTTTPQDGSFGILIGQKQIDFRVSVIPSVYGEAVVIRILRQENTIKINELGFSGRAERLLNEALEKSSGTILTTGPTGSGKTTTLYALVEHLNRPGVKIITVEDPVEYKIEGVSQTPIDTSLGMTFVTALRAILRQDPDVVMVGEVRDSETAEVAIQASLTGHTVLTSLHTNDAVSTVARLADLGVKQFLISSAINLVIAQRLVRRLCRNCVHEDTPDAQLLGRISALLKAVPRTAEVAVPENLKFYTSKGCSECHGLGYKGRLGIYEVFNITPGMEKLILRDAPLSALRQQAIEDGMLTMVQDGLLKAAQGATDIYEVFRVTD